MCERLALILLSCVLCVVATAQEPTLSVGTATAVTGETVTGFIEVSAGSDGRQIVFAERNGDDAEKEEERYKRWKRNGGYGKHSAKSAIKPT